MSKGSSLSRKSNKTLSKLSIGINAIRFSKKRRNGNRAIKKLNDILPAREESVPFKTPETYICKRS
jgi:hypothetical protein